MTREEARDALLGRVLSLFENITPGFSVVYEDTSGKPTDPQWARVSVRHTSGNQATLSSPTGVRRYRRTGILVVELYTPSGKGTTLSDQTSTTIENGFLSWSTPDGLWFRNVRTEEAGNEGQWYHANVIIEFEYDTIV